MPLSTELVSRVTLQYTLTHLLSTFCVAVPSDFTITLSGCLCARVVVVTGPSNGCCCCFRTRSLLGTRHKTCLPFSLSFTGQLVTVANFFGAVPRGPRGGEYTATNRMHKHFGKKRPSRRLMLCGYAYGFEPNTHGKNCLRLSPHV